MQEPSSADLDAIAARLVDAVVRDATTSAAAASFLLRHYLATGRDDLREPLGLALAHALALAAEETSARGRAAWLTLFVDASAIADDDRIAAAARALVAALRAEGAPVRYTEYAGVGHASWTRAYDEAALWEWLFARPC